MAQETNARKYPFNQLRFSVTPSLCSSLNETYIGENIFNSNRSFGIEANISYYQKIVKGFGISLGIGINSTPYNYKFSFITNETDVNNLYYNKEIFVYKYQPMGMLTVPLSLSYAFPIKSTGWKIDLEAGAKFHYTLNSWDNSIDYQWDESWGNATPELIKEKSYYWIENKIENRVLFSYFLKVGCSYTTKKLHTFFANIVGNFSPQRITKGTFMIHAKGGDSSGWISQKPNNWGLELGYALTLCKKQ